MVTCIITGVGCLNQKLLALDCLLHKGPGQRGRRRGELGGGQASCPHTGQLAVSQPALEIFRALLKNL